MYLRGLRVSSLISFNSAFQLAGGRRECGDVLRHIVQRPRRPGVDEKQKLQIKKLKRG